jgi:D-2-hydroxyacid dehydrogenase (NADP+)
VHGPQMAELALSMMLMLQRRLPTMIENQRHRRWQRWPQPVLTGKTVTILGLGAAGRSLARACKALGMRVVGVSASQASAEDFDLVVPRARLAEVCAAADFLVLLAALEPETRRLVGAEVLAALPRRAFLINLARGGLVDEAALIGALRTERVAGAGLDVFDEEPLPPEHPLWDLPNVLLTPHIGGWSDVLVEQAVPLLAHNLGVFLSGRPGDLRNLRRL